MYKTAATKPLEHHAPRNVVAQGNPSNPQAERGKPLHTLETSALYTNTPPPPHIVLARRLQPTPVVTYRPVENL